jgi:hypothetical protein
MAAKATRFCFRTLRTKPLMVRVSPDGAPCCGDVGDRDGDGELSSAAILVGEKVELQRRRHGHCACEHGMAVARRRGNSSGRRKARPRTQRLVLIDATNTSQSAVKQLLERLSCDIEATCGREIGNKKFTTTIETSEFGPLAGAKTRQSSHGGSEQAHPYRPPVDGPC